MDTPPRVRRQKDNEEDLVRRSRLVSTYSRLGLRCIRRMKHQFRVRFLKVTDGAVFASLLDPRTKGLTKQHVNYILDPKLHIRDDESDSEEEDDDEDSSKVGTGTVDGETSDIPSNTRAETSDIPSNTRTQVLVAGEASDTRNTRTTVTHGTGRPTMRTTTTAIGERAGETSATAVVDRSAVFMAALKEEHRKIFKLLKENSNRPSTSRVVVVNTSILTSGESL